MTSGRPWAICPVVMLLLAGSAAAQEQWSWHSADFTVYEGRAVEWALHTRLRTRQGDLQQGRSGTILKFAPRARLNWIAGYYYGREEDTREEWQDSHRLFGGAEVRLYRRGAVTVAARGLAERFLREGRPDLTRLRQRVRLSTRHRIGPYTSGEWFWDLKGYLASRYQGGLRWRASRWLAIEAGYMYDARSPQLGPPRHGLVTQVFISRGR